MACGMLSAIGDFLQTGIDEIMKVNTSIRKLNRFETVIRKLAVTIFSRIFTGEGNYMVHGMRQYRTQRSKLRAVALIGILRMLR